MGVATKANMNIGLCSHKPKGPQPCGLCLMPCTSQVLSKSQLTLVESQKLLVPSVAFESGGPVVFDVSWILLNKSPGWVCSSEDQKGTVLHKGQAKQMSIKPRVVIGL